MLVRKLSSTRKMSEVFISSSLKLVSLTHSFRSEKLYLLVCVTLVYFMGLQKSFFSCFFSLRNLFFAMCSTVENPILIGEEQVKKNFPPFSTSPASGRTTVPLFLLRSWALGTGIENVLDYVYRVVFKNIRLSLLCVCFKGNIIIILPFITILIKSYSNKCETKTVLAWQSLILLEAASFCT